MTGDTGHAETMQALLMMTQLSITQRSTRLMPMEPNHFSIMIGNMVKAEDKARHMEARLRQSTAIYL